MLATSVFTPSNTEHQIQRRSNINSARLAGTARYTEQGRELGGYWIPKGTSCIAPLQIVHLNPAIYPQPKEFQPDRWLPAGESWPRARHLLPVVSAASEESLASWHLTLTGLRTPASAACSLIRSLRWPVSMQRCGSICSAVVMPLKINCETCDLSA